MKPIMFLPVEAEVRIFPDAPKLMKISKMLISITFSLCNIKKSPLKEEVIRLKIHVRFN